MSAAPRVALISHYFLPEYAGGGLQAARMLARLAPRGVCAAVLTSFPGDPADAEPSHVAGGPVVRFRTPRPTQLRDLVLGVRAALWLLRHDDWDLLHCLGYSRAYLLPTLVAQLRGRPVLIKTTLSEPEPSRGLGPALLRGARSYGFRAAGAIVSLSDDLEAELARRYGIERRVVRIPNGVDTELFRPAAAEERARGRRELGLPPAGLVVATCGGLSARKNPTMLLDAAARMKSGAVTLVLAGPESPSASDRGELDQAIARLPERVAVVRPGRLAPARVAELLRAADVFTLTSRAEGMPNSLLEAMATGLPCIATDVPGSRDVLAAGGGELVALDEPGKLAAVLDRLAGDAAERARIGAEARRLVESRYSIERVAAGYLATYVALLAGREPPREP
jgi:glycosyltransferase involved in cell wall biosynthesis